jgi:hypothetical protein
MSDLFPNGWAHYAAGGVLVGLGTAVVFLATGIRAGASGFFTSVLSYASSRAELCTAWALRQRAWRTAFALGIVLGAAAFAVAVAGERFETSVAAWRLGVGGVLVGFGTRTSRGCTSGHGICGLGGLARPAFAAVPTFLAVAIGTALVAQAVAG